MQYSLVLATWRFIIIIIIISSSSSSSSRSSGGGGGRPSISSLSSVQRSGNSVGHINKVKLRGVLLVSWLVTIQL